MELIRLEEMLFWHKAQDSVELCAICVQGPLKLHLCPLWDLNDRR